MCTHLFDYQQQGLSWLMYREGRLSKQELFKHHPEHFTEDRELNPFYEEITLPDSTKLYHNVFSAEISHTFVPVYLFFLLKLYAVILTVCFERLDILSAAF